jgi:hypothetical protein
MLFTVDTKLQHLPQSVSVAQCNPGIAFETVPFTPTAQDFRWSGDIPTDQQGRPIVPGTSEMTMLQDYFFKVVKIDNENVVDLGFRNFHWPGHITLDRPIMMRYTLTRIKSRLGCKDVTWSAELVNGDGKIAVTLDIQQRWYN